MNERMGDDEFARHSVYLQDRLDVDSWPFADEALRARKAEEAFREEAEELKLKLRCAEASVAALNAECVEVQNREQALFVQLGEVRRALQRTHVGARVSLSYLAALVQELGITTLKDPGEKVAFTGLVGSLNQILLDSRQDEVY